MYFYLVILLDIYLLLMLLIHSESFENKKTKLLFCISEFRFLLRVRRERAVRTYNFRKSILDI